MLLEKEHIIKKQGFTLHIIKTDKYKTNTLVWKMRAPLQEDSATYRALLPHVLQSSTKKFPTTTVLRSYLDELYGTSLYTDLAKKGEQHVITFAMDIANEKFLQDQTPLLQKAIDLLQEVLLNPNIVNGAFDEKTVGKEKRNLKQRIESIYDDKMRYASTRLVEEMCKGEPYAIQLNGELDRVDSITATSLYKYYQEAIRNDGLDLYIIGDVEIEKVEEYCNQFQFPERPNMAIKKSDNAIVGEVKEVKEVQDIKQGKLNIGYRTQIAYGDPDYFAMQMFNGIYGGFPHSKLFINVREKESLAYYAASRVESHKGLLIVMSGIENQKYDQAVSIIRKQMELMKAGDFTDQELEQTKAVIQNQFLETVDSARGLIEILYHNVVAGTNVPLQDWIDKVVETTKQDIIKVGKKIELDTIYFLAGEDGEQA
ncbi:EF-P 5-aminopentanol modification-associated protein YfmF [Lederbergia lenta]|uniref:Peptidase M16 domain-containing protein n=1 Tax=Lederbergia lenta TaxID=1467 RepID=A0A2X4WN39_LEDLE|nr:pitrilysin family protein [Lederbergia lenta]MEC2324343.1 pitrilysin family protein [Lederbergia lenta]SQI60112.1 peptidase M16 domain-containing protein [Lederbergia lenta]